MIVHGTMLRIFNYGVLIKGEAGVGKSTLALNLMDRGHFFLADDAVELTADANTLIAKCPEPIQNLLLIRHIGLIPLADFYSSKIIQESRLDLVLQLVPQKEANLLTHELGEEFILNIKIPKIILSTQHPNLALITEMLIWNHFNSSHQGTVLHHAISASQNH